MTTSVLEKGRGYMKQSKISFTYGSGGSVEDGGGEKYILIKGRGQNPLLPQD